MWASCEQQPRWVAPACLLGSGQHMGPCVRTDITARLVAPSSSLNRPSLQLLGVYNYYPLFQLWALTDRARPLCTVT